ncbi:MAG: dihydroorotate dehydrogenase [Candidatus Hodarchaeota archaeon]
MIDLRTKIGDITIRNPLILASGVFGSSYSSLNRAYKEGFGAVTTKSIGIEPRDGYPNPSIIYLPEIKSILNAVGLANPGYIEFTQELNNLKNDVRYIISLFGSNPKEFAQMIEHMNKQIKNNYPIAYELNLSCPHAKKVGIAVGTDPEIVSRIIRTVKKYTHVPIWVKLTPNITDIISIAEAAVSAGADALVAINTLKALKVDIHIKKPVLGNIRGGLSGQAIKPIGIRMIYDLFENYGPKVPLVGVGGVWNWEDVIEYILAGANAVQIGSALADISSPAQLASSIIQGITRYLSEEGTNITELRGKAHE